MADVKNLNDDCVLCFEEETGNNEQNGSNFFKISELQNVVTKMVETKISSLREDIRDLKSEFEQYKSSNTQLIEILTNQHDPTQKLVPLVWNSTSESPYLNSPLPEEQMGENSPYEESFDIQAPPKVCATCKQNIEGGVLIALDKNYHPDHFVCFECKTPITETKFQQNDNEPYCDKCYSQKFLQKCHACGEPIKDKVVTAMGADWHEDHFVCGGCKIKLIGSKFMEIENAPFCQKCYTEKYADKCKACGKPIVTQAVIALDAKWHQLCFKCSKCGKPIMKDQSFRTEGGKPQCVKC